MTSAAGLTWKVAQHWVVSKLFRHALKLPLEASQQAGRTVRAASRVLSLLLIQRWGN